MAGPLVSIITPSYNLIEETIKNVLSHDYPNIEYIVVATFKHFNRAPLNRVYGYCYYLVKSRMPEILANLKPLVVLLSVIVTAIEYLRLNRGICAEDLKLMNPGNLKKIFGGWEASDILKKGRRTLK